MPKKTIHRSIRYDEDTFKFYTAVSAVSSIPRDKLVKLALRAYRTVLESKYPEAKDIMK